ncbi:MAG: hypothetical protein GQ549_04895 [Gammaproteobacteria bacterium]|nr:hypothetical protein [Gammaproteobacteria bacterium]
MKLYKRILAALFSGLLLIGLSACDKSAEDVGESIDDAASDVADKTEDASDAIKEKLDE